VRGAIQHPSCRPNEWRSLQILAVAGLLADEEEPGRRRSIPEDGLRRARPQLAGPASGCQLAQRLEAPGALDRRVTFSAVECIGHTSD